MRTRYNRTPDSLSASNKCNFRFLCTCIWFCSGLCCFCGRTICLFFQPWREANAQNKLWNTLQTHFIFSYSLPRTQFNLLIQCCCSSQAVCYAGGILILGSDDEKKGDNSKMKEPPAVQQEDMPSAWIPQFVPSCRSPHNDHVPIKNQW